jgi:carboxypeptidase family protein
MVRLFSLCALVFVLAAAGCGKSDDSPVTPTVGTIATLQGTVLTPGPSGYVPLAGVSLSIEGVNLTSGSDGTYAVSGLKPGDVVLTAARAGYQTFVGRVSLDGAVTFNFLMVPQPLRSTGR